MQRRGRPADKEGVVDTSRLSYSTASVLPCLTDPLPRHLGDYELLERVGRGATAEVWLARRSVVPGGVKPCALKIIHRDIAEHPRHRRMFMQESRLALKMSHANIVSVFDVGEAVGRLYIVLEWIDGTNLRDFCEHVRAQGDPLSIPEICYITGEILQGLRHAHELRAGGRALGVIHRDIAPHNVMISSAGEVKLGDFGIARVCGEGSSGMHIKGRVRYMAPEQLRGEPVQASDLFAVGALLHELLEGRRFREGIERRPDWYQVVSKAPLMPLHRNDLPPALEALRIGLLEPDPTRRIASASEALDGLMRCPPWSSGAAALRRRYQRCVGLIRRTGLTGPYPPAPNSRLPLPRRTPGRPPGARAIASDYEPTATLRRSKPDLAAYRRALPTLPLRRLSPTSPWLRRGLWGLAIALGLTAAGLFAAPAWADPSVTTTDEP